MWLSAWAGDRNTAEMTARKRRIVKPTHRLITLMISAIAALVSVAASTAAASASTARSMAQTGTADIDVTHTIRVGTSPIGVAVNPATNVIYVTNRDDNTVSVISGQTK